MLRPLFLCSLVNVCGRSKDPGPGNPEKLTEPWTRYRLRLKSISLCRPDSKLRARLKHFAVPLH